MKNLLFLSFVILHLSSQGQTKYQKDFSFYWTAVHDAFGYFDKQKTDWNKVREIYQPIVDTITNNSSFIKFLETVNDELYNGHISLNTNLPSSNRLIPTGTDLWVLYKEKQFVVTAVRDGFPAQRSGLKPGMKIIQFNGERMENAIKQFLPKSVSAYDERMYEYAGNMLLAGRHNVKRSITAIFNGVVRTYNPDSVSSVDESGYSTLLDQKIISPGIGYIRINNSLGDHALIQAFDNALDGMQNTNGLIIDLRETPSGGNTTVARAIMSRFIDKEMAYQKHTMPDEEREFGVKRSWIELVTPRGKIYHKPLVILVNRWTGSMGEGMAIGFDGMKRAKIVGDKMASLLGAIYSYTLPETNIGFSIPVEKLYQINGIPREDFVPGYFVKDDKTALPLAIRLLTTRKKSRR